MGPRGRTEQMLDELGQAERPRAAACAGGPGYRGGGTGRSGPRHRGRDPGGHPRPRGRPSARACPSDPRPISVIVGPPSCSASHPTDRKPGRGPAFDRLVGPEVRATPSSRQVPRHRSPLGARGETRRGLSRRCSSSPPSAGPRCPPSGSPNSGRRGPQTARSRSQLLVRRAATHQRAQVVAARGEQAGVQLAFGGEARARCSRRRTAG